MNKKKNSGVKGERIIEDQQRGEGVRREGFWGGGGGGSWGGGVCRASGSREVIF